MPTNAATVACQATVDGKLPAHEPDRLEQRQVAAALADRGNERQRQCRDGAERQARDQNSGVSPIVL